jgi:hypothetical protein
MQNSQVNIRRIFLYKLVLPWVAWKYAEAVSTEEIQRAVVTALQVELSTTSAMASNPDPSVGQECQKANLDTTVGKDAKSLDL